MSGGSEMTAGSIASAVGVRQIAGATRALSSLPEIDYVDLFTLELGSDPGASPERWAGAGDVWRRPQRRRAGDLARSARAPAQLAAVPGHRGRLADRRARRGLDPARDRVLVPVLQPPRAGHGGRGVAGDLPAVRPVGGPRRVAAAVRRPSRPGAGGAPRRGGEDSCVPPGKRLVGSSVGSSVGTAGARLYGASGFPAGARAMLRND